MLKYGRIKDMIKEKGRKGNMNRMGTIKKLIVEERDLFGNLISCTSKLYNYNGVIENSQERETEEIVKEVYREGLVQVEFSARKPILFY